MIHTVIFSSSDDALPLAEALHADSDISIAGFVTQPAKPRGRGMRKPDTKIIQWARANGIPLLSTASLNSPESERALRTFHANVFFVYAFGLLIPRRILAIPPNGAINLHPSLLPKYRGAAPVTAALLNGDAETGITFMVLDEGFDTGPIIAQERVAIEDTDTQTTLRARLVDFAAKELVPVMKAYVRGVQIPVPQQKTDEKPTRRLTREDGELSFTQPAEKLARMIRAYEGWPGTYTFWEGQRLLVMRARSVPADSPTEPGTVQKTPDGFPAVHTAHNALILEEIQLPGKKPTDGPAFLRGHRSFVGSRIPS